MKCPFCPPCELELVFDGGECFAVELPSAVLPGSIMILPKAHRATVFDLTSSEWQESLALLRRVKALVDGRHQPDGYNVGWNCGAVGGQRVAHAHLHVVPRHADEPHAGCGIRHWIKQSDNRRPSASIPTRPSADGRARSRRGNR